MSTCTLKIRFLRKKTERIFHVQEKINNKKHFFNKKKSHMSHLKRKIHLTTKKEYRQNQPDGSRQFTIIICPWKSSGKISLI